MQVSEGVNSCTSNDSLPRNINQAYNQRRTSSVECDKTSSLDPHNSCVLLCKEETKNINTALIREVNIAPELEVECANEKQLDDVVKFCTNENFGIFEVDPKYNLGDFYVTTSKYQHLLLLKTGSGGKKGKLRLGQEEEKSLELPLLHKQSTPFQLFPQIFEGGSLGRQRLFPHQNCVNRVTADSANRRRVYSQVWLRRFHKLLSRRQLG